MRGGVGAGGCSLVPGGADLCGPLSEGLGEADAIERCLSPPFPPGKGKSCRATGWGGGSRGRDRRESLAGPSLGFPWERMDSSVLVSLSNSSGFGL